MNDSVSTWFLNDIATKCIWITPQELLLTRLAMGIVEREDDDVTMEKLDKALGELFEKKVMKPAMEVGGGGDPSKLST